MERFGPLRLPREVFAPAGDGSEKKQESPMRAQNPTEFIEGPDAKKRNLKTRKNPGRPSSLEKALSESSSRRGQREKVFRPKTNLTPSEVERMYKIKGAAREGLLNSLIKDLTRDAATQLVRLGEDTVKAGGAERGSGRYVLAQAVAKTIAQHFTLQKVGQQMVGEESVPLFKRWTWLSSNGYVLGDPKAYMRTLSADPKKAKEREAEFENFEKKRKPELDAQVLDRIGEELDKIAKWAQAKRHNDSLKERIDSFQRENPKGKIDPKDPQFKKRQESGFPAKSFVAYLAHELNIPGLQKEYLENMLGTLPYSPYQYVSAARREERARMEKIALEAQPRRERGRADAETLRIAQSLERQTELGKLIEVAHVRKDKAQALLLELRKNQKTQPGQLREIATRTESLVKAHADFITDATKSMAPADKRGWLGKVIGAQRNVGELLTQSRFEGLRAIYKRLDAIHWQTLEKRINHVVGAIPAEIRAALKLSNVVLDTLDTRKVTVLISSLKNGFVALRAPKQPETQEQQTAYLRTVVPKLEAQFKQIPKLPERAKDRQSVDSQIKYLQLLIDPKITEVDAKKMEMRNAAIKKAARRYRARDIK